MNKLDKKTDVRAVVDANIFVPAIACSEPEARFYAAAVRVCWKLVFSEPIIEEYEQLMLKYGHPFGVIRIELSKLQVLNKYRCCETDVNDIGEDLAPRKDRHIVAPCRGGYANAIITRDRGIHQRKAIILTETRARVLSLEEAQALLDNS